MDDFLCKNSAPVTGITLSTRVGRLSETHSDIGFQLHSVPTLGRKVMERHGGKVGKNCMVEQCLHSDRTVWLNNVCTLTVSVVASLLQACGGRRFWGLSRKDHGIKQRKIGVTAWSELAQVRPEGVPSGFHRGARSVFVEW